MSLAAHRSYVVPFWQVGGDNIMDAHLQCTSAREADDTTDGTKRIQGERVRDHAAHAYLTSGAQGRSENIQVAGAAFVHCTGGWGCFWALRCGFRCTDWRMRTTRLFKPKLIRS